MSALGAVRFGTMRNGVFHLAPGILGIVAKRALRAGDIRPLCGVNDNGLSPCIATVEAAREFGPVCKRCEKEAAR